MRINGKHWHHTRDPSSSIKSSTKVKSSSFANRQAKTQALAATKAKVAELKDEREAERQRRITAIRERRVAKAEKERVQKLEERMHRKRVERLRKREKRNKLLNS